MSEKRERGHGSIRRRGTTLQLRYYKNGAQIEEPTKFPATPEGYKKAEKELRKRLGQIEAGVFRMPHRYRYEDFRAAYFADYEAQQRKSLRRRKKTGEPYLPEVNRLDRYFAGWRITKINADDIRAFTAALRDKGLSNGSINRSISALRKMFNLAVKDQKLDQNNVPHFPMPKEAKARTGFFETAEYEALSCALPVYLRLPLALGFFTGMRLGEVLGLEWEQVDLLNNSIVLRQGETKNDEGRVIPLIPQLRTLVLEQRAARQPDCPYVCFRLDHKGHAVKIDSFRKAWYRACVAAGLGKMEPSTNEATGLLHYMKPRGPRSKPKVKMVYTGKLYHDLRRTGVRNLVRAGVSEKVAMSISGHKTRSVFDRYNITSGKDALEAGEKLAKFMDKSRTNAVLDEGSENLTSSLQEGCRGSSAGRAAVS